MSDDPVRQTRIDSIRAVRAFSCRLTKIKGSRDYYSWFNERVDSLNDDISDGYSDFLRRFESLDRKKLLDIPDEFVDSFLHIANFFSRFYHVKSIYDSCETGIVSPYFVDNLQFNVMVRFFNFINSDSSKMLIPPPYDLQFTERKKGLYNEDHDYSGILLEVLNTALGDPSNKMVFLTVKIYYHDGNSHQNILLFNKESHEIYLIEPSLEMNLRPAQSQGREIDSFLPAITQYISINFREYTFKGFFRSELCNLPYHGGFCAPLSFVLILRPDITNYNSFIKLIKNFVDLVMQEILDFGKVLQQGMQNPTSSGSSSGIPDDFTQRFDAYNDSDEDSSQLQFGNNEIKYLRKILKKNNNGNYKYGRNTKI